MEFETDYGIRDFLDNLPVDATFTDDMGIHYTVFVPGVFKSDSGAVFTSKNFDAYDVIDLEVDVA